MPPYHLSLSFSFYVCCNNNSQVRGTVKSTFEGVLPYPPNWTSGYTITIIKYNDPDRRVDQVLLFPVPFPMILVPPQVRRPYVC